MKVCPACSTEVESMNAACSCGHQFSEEVSPASVSTPSINAKWLFAAGGAFAGGILGFLLRPSAPFLGQLPFGTVISGGSNLQGLDMLLKATAQTSLNFLLAGIVLGGLVGFGIGYFKTNKGDL